MYISIKPIYLFLPIADYNQQLNIKRKTKMNGKTT